MALHSLQRRALGLDVPPRGAERRGLRRHYTLTPWSEDVEVWWGPRSEAYVTPVAPRTVGVAVLTADVGTFDEHLADFPELAARLAEGTPASAVRGAGPFGRRSRRRVAGRVLLVGDAAGYVDALTGEGLSLGFAQARAAVGALARDRPGEYERAWRRLSWPADLPTAVLVRAGRVAALRRRIVRAAAAAPTLFDAAVSAVALTGKDR